MKRKQKSGVDGLNSGGSEVEGLNSGGSEVEGLDLGGSQVEELDSNGMEHDGKEGRSKEPQPPNPKKQKTDGLDINQEFSLEEISKLKKMESVIDWSLFKMQVSELLKNVSVKQKLRSRVEFVVRYLSKKIIALPDGSEFKLNNKSWLDTQTIQVPMAEMPEDNKAIFKFIAPTEVRLIGSGSLGTFVKPHVEVDLALLISEECVDRTDHLNHRYNRKKALYLAALASHLSTMKRVETLNYAYDMGNPLRPLLIASVRGEDSKIVQVRLHIIPESHPFKLSSFHPVKNNVRPKWFFGKESEFGTDKQDGASFLPATKHYNSSILQDLCMMANEEFISAILSGADKLKQGLMLLKIWLRQRALSQGRGMFSNFLMTAYVAFLVKTNKLNKLMSSYQVFKTTLHCLESSDWHAEPPSLCDEEPCKGLPTMEDYKNAFPCVFLDSTGSYNLAYALSDNLYKRMKEDCKASLSQSDGSAFEGLFISAVVFSRKFDHIFHVKVDSEFLGKSFDKNKNMANKELDLGASCRTLIMEDRIVSVLVKALGKRAVTFQSKPIPNTKWHVSCKPFEYDNRTHLTFGLVLDPLEAFNSLTKGPPGDAPEAMDFRSFWGQKAEMRRFKDGSILEVVLWSTSSNQSDKRIICQSIVIHILKIHFNLATQDIIYRGNTLDSLLALSPIREKELLKYGTGEEHSLAVSKVFDEVYRCVRSVADLPLPISTIHGVHPVFRHAEVFPPIPYTVRYSSLKAWITRSLPISDIHAMIPALPVICCLAGSGKWPDEKEALDCMKALLHCKLGQELGKKNSMCVSIHPTYVDVFKDGFVFRLILTCAKEISVMRTFITESGIKRFEDTKTSFELERDTIALPLHSQIIHSIQQQHPVFSATVRLCKRWLSCQMIWKQLRHEVVELLVASLFINTHLYSPPMSSTVGFMSFLNLLSTFDWKKNILMVNLGSEFSDKDYSEIPKTFETNRCNLPAMCVATPKDKKGSLWTSSCPDQVVLDRLVILARAHLSKLESQVMSFDPACDFKIIFRPLLDLFDVTIMLKPTLNLHQYKTVDRKGVVFVAPAPKEVLKMPVVDFDIYTRFLEDLQNLYGDIALFFYDQHGGEAIGLVWKKSALDQRGFKASNLTKRKPVHEGEKVTLEVERDAILEDIRTIGIDIVKTIVNNRQDR